MEIKKNIFLKSFHWSIFKQNKIFIWVGHKTSFLVSKSFINLFPFIHIVLHHISAAYFISPLLY